MYFDGKLIVKWSIVKKDDKWCLRGKKKKYRIYFPFLKSITLPAPFISGTKYGKILIFFINHVDLC